MDSLRTRIVGLKEAIEGVTHVENLMTKEVVTTDKKTSIIDVAGLMEKKNISSVVVVEERGPMGIVTERDLVRKAILKRLDLDEPIEKIMSSPLTTAEKNMDIPTATGLMMKESIRRLPVVEKGELVGIITATDLLDISPKYVMQLSSTMDKIEGILKNL